MMLMRCSSSLFSSLVALMRFAVIVLVLSVQFADSAHARVTSGSIIDHRPPTYGNINSPFNRDAELPDPNADNPFVFLNARGDDGSPNRAFLQLCPEGYLASRIVYCIRAVIEGALENYLTTFSLALNGFILGMITLAVTIFGAKILVGASEKPGVDASMLLLKIGGVLLFTNLLGGFVQWIFPIMESFSSYGMSYMGGNSQSIILSSCSADNAYDSSIWARVDCILRRLMIGATGVGVLWVLAFALFWSSIFGGALFILMAITFIGIVFFILRCVFMFLGAYIAITFMVAISPLIIPLILFKQTERYFSKWLRNFLPLFIQPMLLFAYMMFVFALIDSMFFQDNEYSLSSILGIQWEQEDTTSGGTEEHIQTNMADYADKTGFGPDTREYQNRERYMREHVTFHSVGNVNIAMRPLINIDIDVRGKYEETRLSDVPIVGAAVGGMADVVGAITDVIGDAVSRRLIPFEVPHVKMQPDEDGDAPRIMVLMWDLTKFFVVMLILTALMFKFHKTIPDMVQRLSGSIFTTPSVPGERQVKGTIGAVGGATRGAVEGAVAGFATGGKAGAVAGAKEGAVRGGVEGYRNAAKSHGNRNQASRSGMAGTEHANSSMAKEGAGTSRKVLHGERGGGGRGGIGAGKGIVKDVAIQAATRGKGGKGGAGGGGAGGAGGGAGAGGAGKVPR